MKRTWMIAALVAAAGCETKSESGTGSAPGSDPGSAKASVPPTDSAAAADSAAPKPMILPDFLEDPLCQKVAAMIMECAKTPEFAAALDNGATEKQKRINAKLRKNAVGWAEPGYLCKDFWALSEYDYPGFLDEPSVFQEPNVLDSCATIGAAVRAGGGLVGNK